MGVDSDFVGIPAFEVLRPDTQRVPFVFNSPHSGSYYPPRFLAMSRLDPMTIRRSEDCHVDELFRHVIELGAPLLKANFPRAYVDANREAWELDARMFYEPLPPYANTRSPRVAGGLGTVPRLVGEGKEIYSSPLPLAEAMSRIALIYRPYHACLAELLYETRAKFGFAVLVDCHSMPGGGQAGGVADFIIGDRFGTSAVPEISRYALTLLAKRGYRAAYNKPYAGGFITEYYGRPGSRLSAVQLEINRSLYMDEQTFERSPGFASLQHDIVGFTAAMTEWVQELSSSAAIAAE